MSASPSSESTNDSDIRVAEATSASYAGKRGKWKLVHIDDLERVALPTEDSCSTSDSPAATPEPLSSLVSTAIVDATSGSGSPTTDASVPAKPKLQLQRRQQLEHHLKSNPTDLDSFMELAQIYRAENRPVEARRVLQQALEIFPDEEQLLWEFEEATLSRSLQQLREVTDLASRLNTAETDRELTRCQQDWAMRRIAVCQSRLNRDPSLMHLRVSLGEAKYEAGSFDEAIEELDLLLDRDEFSPAAYLIRGKCLLAKGKELDAMVALRACALRRAVVAPLRLRILALRLLCETSDRLGLTLTLANYQNHLQQAEKELGSLP